MALVKQISSIVNDAVKDALGKNATLTALDSTDIVSLGKALNQFDAYEAFYSSLTNRLVKTVYFVRHYAGKNRNILKDEHEYGAFIQKVYYEMPESHDNPTFEIPTTQGKYTQASPYDVDEVVAVSSLIFGGKGTWTIEIIRPIEQIKSAFLNESEMMRFIDGIYTTVENKMKLDIDALEALAANTGMALTISKGKSRNLLSEYNTLTGGTLTVAQAMTNKEFLKYACREIKDTISYMQNMSTAFNADGYTTFTDKAHLSVELLTKFASASETYLEADTFHNELVKLPLYGTVDYWQAPGTSFAFADVSAIKIRNDDIDADPISQTGIVAFIHDTEFVGAYFGNRRSWELPNMRSEVMIHGEKATKGYAVDSHANAVVFYIA